jgi:hypothetical protein
MARSRHFLAFVALLLTAGLATAQVQEGQWVSYRDAYRAMVVFEKYGNAKNFIQNHFQVMPREKGVPTDGLRLALSGATTQLNLPLDPTGRAVFPLLKAAYDENAVLVLNRAVSQYVLRPRVSIVIRADGVYQASELRAACEQALAYQRLVEAGVRGKTCAGVRFVFASKGVEPRVRLRRGDSEQALPVLEGAAFDGDPNDGFKIVNVRFAASPPGGQVVAQDAPLAIAPLFE